MPYMCGERPQGLLNLADFRAYLAGRPAAGDRLGEVLLDLFEMGLIEALRDPARGVLIRATGVEPPPEWDAPPPSCPN
jgi:hypothetical protein